MHYAMSAICILAVLDVSYHFRAGTIQIYQYYTAVKKYHQFYRNSSFFPRIEEVNMGFKISLLSFFFNIRTQLSSVSYHCLKLVQTSLVMANGIGSNYQVTPYYIP